MSKAPLHRIAARLFSEPWLIKSDVHASLVGQFKNHLRGSGEPVRVKLEDESPPKGPAADMDCLRDVTILDGVAVLPVEGILGKHLSMIDMLCGGYDLRLLEQQAMALMHRADVHTVLTTWHTPGGQAAGLAETGQILMNLGAQKRHIAYCTEACSGGYWLASTAEMILCGNSDVLGSISAVCAIEDVSQMYADLGIKMEVFTDGDQKGAGIEGTSLSETQRAGIQARIEHIGGMFKAFVKSRRPGVTDDLLQGQWFYGDQALTNGLADGYCPSLEHAIAIAMERP